MRYRIINTVSGHDFGTFEADDEESALDAMAQEAGYRDHVHACAVAPVKEGELLVEPIE